MSDCCKSSGCGSQAADPNASAPLLRRPTLNEIAHISASLFVLGVAALVLSGCTTAPTPSEADIAFEEFRKRLLVTSPSASPAQAQKSAVENSFSQTNHTTLTLPPPFLQLPQQKAAREEVENSGVSPALVERMVQGQILTLAEIEQLAQHKVSDTNLVKYLRSTGAIYTLSTRQIDELRAAPVSNEVLDYLLATPTLRRRTLYYPLSFHHPYSPWWGHHDYGLYHYDHHFDDHHH